MYDKSGEIEHLRQKLNQLEAGDNKPSGYWQRLSDYCGKMSPDQLSFVDTNQKVVEARNQMFEAFTLYLFDKHKTEFAEVETCRPFCDTYVDTVLQASQQYADEVATAISEKAKLEERIRLLELELKEKKNAKPKAE